MVDFPVTDKYQGQATFGQVAKIDGAAVEAVPTPDSLADKLADILTAIGAIPVPISDVFVYPSANSKLESLIEDSVSHGTPGTAVLIKRFMFNVIGKFKLYYTTKGPYDGTGSVSFKTNDIGVGVGYTIPNQSGYTVQTQDFYVKKGDIFDIYLAHSLTEPQAQYQPKVKDVKISYDILNPNVVIQD